MNATLHRYRLGNFSIFIAIFIIVIVISYKTLPSFLYNEYEYQFRQEILTSYNLSDKVEDAIQTRRYGLADGTVTSQEHKEIGQQIVATIKRVQEHLARGNEKMFIQNRIPFLPKSYKEYHEGKNLAFSEYSRLSSNFLLKKENDHMLTDTIVLIANIDSVIYDMKNPQWWDTSASLLENSKLIQVNADKLKDNAFISDRLYKYLTSTSQLYQFMFYQGEKVSADKSWDNYDIKKIIELTELRQKYDLTSSIAETWRIGDQINAKYQEEFTLNSDDLSKWSDFYNENRLAFDPVSIFLSRFIPLYPHNHNPETSPTILPGNTIPEKVSLILN